MLFNAHLFGLLFCLSTAASNEIPDTAPETTTGDKDPFTFPPSCDLNSAFTSYSINHLSLITPNLTRALDFYTQALGLSHIFTYNPVPKYSLAYLGHNTAGFTSCAEFAQRKNEIKGLVEFIHLEGATNNPPPTIQKPNTYSHFGLIVPDVKAAEERVEAAGGKVIKRGGEELDVTAGGLANAYGLGEEAIGNLEAGELEAIVEAFRDARTGAVQSAFVEDLDGNLIEIQPPVFE